MFVSTNLGRLLILSILLWHNVAFSDNVSSSMLKIERFSAERGDAQSQYFMGEHYEQGDSGLPRDLNAALNWYYKAADKGNAAAQYKIGLFHEKGYVGLSGGVSAAMPWYEKAAAGGNDAARLKIEAVKNAGREVAATQRQKNGKQRQQERERSRMLQASKPAMAGLPLKLPKQRVRESRPAETIDKLMASNWFHAGHPAEYLPAEDMSCLKSSEFEVTCFSRTRNRIVGENRMEFTVKSVITDFSGGGSFRARYFYNVAEIDDAPTPGPVADPYGLRVEEGWQKNGHDVACHVNGANSVVCSSKDRNSVRFDRK